MTSQLIETNAILKLFALERFIQFWVIIQRSWAKSTIHLKHKK